MFDDRVHNCDGTIGDDDQDCCECTGKAICTLLCELVDLDGDEQIARGDQKNDCGDCGDASDEGGDKSAEERILDTGMTQRDGMGREEGGGFRMGNTCIPVVDSF